MRGKDSNIFFNHGWRRQHLGVGAYDGLEPGRGFVIDTGVRGYD